jgi:hypothetical protein
VPAECRVGAGLHAANFCKTVCMPDYLHVVGVGALLLTACRMMCCAAGGYAVVKGLQQAMRLPVEKVLPSFATLRDYGNTSCSTTW